jgi:Ca2+-binding RTX toxin-like protein
MRKLGFLFPCAALFVVLGCVPNVDEYLETEVGVERSAITYISTRQCSSPYLAYGNVRSSSVLAICCWEGGRWVLRSTTAALSRSPEGVLIYGDAETNFITSYEMGITCILGDRSYTVGGTHSSWVYPLVIDGGGGRDYIWGLDMRDAAFQHHLVGGDGDDRLFVGANGGYADGSAGNDLINGGSGDDLLLGGPGNDQINGMAGADLIEGEDGDDVLLGQAGADLIYGGNGRDTIEGGDGMDILAGQAGHDIIRGGSGHDWIYGDGTPHPGDFPEEWELWPYYHDEPWMYSPPISGDWDELYGEDGDDHLFGESGADHLHGGTGNDILYAGSGNDICYGEEGRDAIFGEDGHDDLFGGSGDDTIVGGDDGEVDWCWGEDEVDSCECLMEYTCEI